MTLRQAIVEASTRLLRHPDLAPTARRDAELLALHTTGWPRTIFFTDPDRTLDPSDRARLDALIDRRLTGEPIQYILREQEFYGLALTVTPAVLIPRPETELLVEAVLGQLSGSTHPLCIADVGTGSGAIAIAMAANLPAARVTAIDLSPEALEVARDNAHRHRVGDRINFVQSDLLEALSDRPAFDAILSNPPYVPQADSDTLHRQVRDFEPHQALFAGADGLDVYRRLIPQAAERLESGGLLAMEFGHGQRPALEALLHDWAAVEFLDDLQGIPRIALARKPA